MRICILLVALIAACCSSLSADVCVLGGSRFVLRSTGSKLESGGWEMKSNGYLGTYLSLPKQGPVLISVKASGRNAIMHLHVGDKRFVQQINRADAREFAFKCVLPAGLHRLRIELNSSKSSSDSSLRVDFMTVSGAGVQVSEYDCSDELVLRAADSYIENYRKGDVGLSIVNAFGKPLPRNTIVRVKLRKHAYNFGTALYGTNAQNGDWLQDKPAPGSDAAKYQEFAKSHFNTIVPENAGKWASCEGERDVETMSFLDSMLAWAAKNGLRARMHCVLWGQSMPKWADEELKVIASPDAQQSAKAARSDLRKEISERIKCLVADRAGRYMELDGLNESAHQDGVIKAYGPDGVASIYSEIIKASAGRARVYFNEFNLFQWNKEFGYKDEYGNWYRDHIDKIISSGIRPADRSRIGIGMQYYPSMDQNARDNSPHSPVRIAKVLQTMAGLEMPITLSEFAVWQGGESEAPRCLSETMRLVFGGDYTTSFLTWGFCKSHMWAKGSAFVDENWNLTDTGKVYEQLLGIHNWGIAGVPQWTTDLSLKADRKGKITFRGFYGDYDVLVNGRTYPLTISKGKTNYSMNVLQ